MLTEEKLQKFLDDLRLGKYDDEKYEITTAIGRINIKDHTNNIETSVSFYSASPEFWKAYGVWNARLKIWKWIFKKPKYTDYPLTYMANTFKGDFCRVSKSLYESFDTYCKELIEKDKLVKRSNIESSFGL